MATTKLYAVHMCDFRSPPGDTECMEAVWSMGGSCKKCRRHDCYRCGWSKDRVTADNARLVERKHSGKI